MEKLIILVLTYADGLAIAMDEGRYVSALSPPHARTGAHTCRPAMNPSRKSIG